MLFRLYTVCRRRGVARYCYVHTAVLCGHGIRHSPRAFSPNLVINRPLGGPQPPVASQKHPTTRPARPTFVQKRRERLPILAPAFFTARSTTTSPTASIQITAELRNTKLTQFPRRVACSCAAAPAQPPTALRHGRLQFHEGSRAQETAERTGPPSYWKQGRPHRPPPGERQAAGGQYRRAAGR